MQRLRQGLPALSDALETPAPRLRPPSPRQVAGIFLRRSTDRTAVEQQVLGQVIERCPDARVAYAVSDRFLSLLRQRQAASLAAWLTDQAAVVAAASLPYSNGQTEGQVNKLKVVTRQMYGRAKFDLLRLRLLHAA